MIAECLEHLIVHMEDIQTAVEENFEQGGIGISGLYKFFCFQIFFDI